MVCVCVCTCVCERERERERETNRVGKQIMQTKSKSLYQHLNKYKISSTQIYFNTQKNNRHEVQKYILIEFINRDEQ